MGKVVLYIAQSLDGYISRENGAIDWLWDEQDYGFDEFYHTIDTVVLGRKTYEQIVETTNEFPYKSKDVYVVSQIEEGNDQYATFIQPEQISPLMEMLRTDQNKDIWLVGGSRLIDHFRSMDLIDQYHIAIQPTLIGRGTPLFQPNNKEQQLSLTDMEKYDNGMLLLTYRRREKENII